MNPPNPANPPQTAAVQRAPPLPLFAIIEAPYGMQNNLITFIAMVLLRNSGVDIGQASAIAAFCLVPSTFYFLYAPMVDFFVRRRTWLLAAVVVTALLAGGATLLASGSHVRFVTAVLFASTVTSMLISAATGGLMSSLLNRGEKARVGAWVQLGNLGGGACFFGLMLVLEPHFGRTTLAAIATALILLPGIAVFWIHEPERVRLSASVASEPGTGGYLTQVRAIGRELRLTLFSWRSLVGILLLGSPIGSSAITTVLSGLTREYGASAGELGFANGWGGGLLCALGALCILLAPPRWNRTLPYALAGIVYGGVSLLIAAGPLRPSTLIAGLLASNFVQGICFAAYTGLVLQTAGMGGRIHSSRYTILNSIGNLPVVYMTALEGQVAGHFGARAVGLFDGGLNLLTVAIFFVWWTWMRMHRREFLEAPEVALSSPA
jgi:PAT family beta-lactamase induction signal transducer AmpG